VQMLQLKGVSEGVDKEWRMKRGSKEKHTTCPLVIDVWTCHH
jgi:hypothetical protein